MLEGTKQYRVPLYQRTYSWSEQQCKRLWEDIKKLADDRRADPAATHFIGSVVLAPSPEIGPVGVQEFLVVDGQQRLTTLSILLCAIRDHRAGTEDPMHRGRIEQLYLINQFESDPHRLKLVPTQADRDAYLACVESAPHAGDNVYRIFESLNNTGLQLTQADLLRNYLFMRLPTRGETVYESLWFPLQDALDRNDRDRKNLELLFWLDLVQRDGRAKQTDIYAAHQQRLNAMRGEAEIEAEVRRFSRLGALLKIILHPESEPDLEVRRRLTRLHAWGATTVYPLLLHLLDRRAQGTATAGQIIAAMRYVESFFVRRLVIGRATANLNRILMSIVTEMDPKLPVDEAVRAYLSTGRKHYATDAQVRSSTRTIPFLLNGRAHQRNLVLQWLEEAHRSKEPVAADSLSIEHVLPQTPTAQWRQMLNDDLGPDENFTDVHESLVHTIGNLTLTGYNSELGNKPFDAKKAALARSPIVLNRDIARQERWRRPEIQARSEALAEQIISLWPGPAETSRDHDSDVPWDVMNRALAELPARIVDHVRRRGRADRQPPGAGRDAAGEPPGAERTPGAADRRHRLAKLPLARSGPYRRPARPAAGRRGRVRRQRARRPGAADSAGRAGPARRAQHRRPAPPPVAADQRGARRTLQHAGGTAAGSAGGRRRAGCPRRLDRAGRQPALRHRRRGVVLSHRPRQGPPARQHLAGDDLSERQVRDRLPALQEPGAVRRHGAACGVPATAQQNPRGEHRGGPDRAPAGFPAAGARRPGGP
ncbi:GmrSD restriction endonuclease domain-containing protein [Micromonospora sp. LOL_015]|uniref:GmrSD restriction endonuclease domain-containing protein n=1 Tax=Micromonospora sp. LOL_015 TaxID=3345416 RepID=UPI003A8AAFFE